MAKRKLIEFAELVDRHLGEHALLLATGPSFEKIQHLNGWDEGPVIGINRAPEGIKFAPDYWLFIDQFKNVVRDIPNDLDYHFRWAKPVRPINLVKDGRLSFDKSGLTGMSIAYQLGCSKISLAGFDFYQSSADGRRHFYDEPGTTESGKCLIAAPEQITALAYLRNAGIKIHHYGEEND